MRYFIFSRNSAIVMVLLAMLTGLFSDAMAQRHVGGHANINRGANVNHNLNREANVNHNVNRNLNVNRNVNVHRDIDVDVDHGWAYDHPYAAGAAVVTGAAVTAAVIGSVVRSIPPACVPVIVNGFTYQQCGSTWYQPQYAGTQVTYVVVNPPG